MPRIFTHPVVVGLLALGVVSAELTPTAGDPAKLAQTRELVERVVRRVEPQLPGLGLHRRPGDSSLLKMRPPPQAAADAWALFSSDEETCVRTVPILRDEWIPGKNERHYVEKGTHALKLPTQHVTIFISAQWKPGRSGWKQLPAMEPLWKHERKQTARKLKSRGPYPGNRQASVESKTVKYTESLVGRAIEVAGFHGRLYVTRRQGVRTQVRFWNVEHEPVPVNRAVELEAYMMVEESRLTLGINVKAHKAGKPWVPAMQEAQFIRLLNIIAVAVREELSSDGNESGQLPTLKGPTATGVTAEALMCFLANRNHATMTARRRAQASYKTYLELLHKKVMTPAEEERFRKLVSEFAHFHDLGELFIRFGREYGIRAEFALFMTLIETANLTYPGEVRSDQNCFGGVGASGVWVRRKDGFRINIKKKGNDYWGIGVDPPYKDKRLYIFQRYGNTFTGFTDPSVTEDLPKIKLRYRPGARPVIEDGEDPWRTGASFDEVAHGVEALFQHLSLYAGTEKPGTPLRAEKSRTSASHIRNLREHWPGPIRWSDIGRSIVLPGAKAPSSVWTPNAKGYVQSLRRLLDEFRRDYLTGKKIFAVDPGPSKPPGVPTPTRKR